MASLNDLDLNALRRAASTIDELGEANALRAFGFGASTTWRAVIDGKSYPSKALVGIALELRARDFQGGIAQVVPALRKLDVVVTRNGRPVSSLEDVARSAGFHDLYRKRTELEVPARVNGSASITFASGTNRVGTIRGMARAGFDVGITVNDVKGSREDALLELAGTEVNVFVDSGAFSEVDFDTGAPVVVKPIDAAAWRNVLETYKRLGRALRSQLYVVAPDMVGNQAVTLERLERYADDLRELDELDVNILVPMQLGAMSQAAFARVVDELLEGVRWFPALPCMKAETRPDQVEAFVAERRPAFVHLLGIGTKAREVQSYIDAATSAGADVSLDSNLLRSLLGRTNGPKGGPRAVTMARDLAVELLAGAATAAAVAELAVLLVLLGA